MSRALPLAVLTLALLLAPACGSEATPLDSAGDDDASAAADATSDAAPGALPDPEKAGPFAAVFQQDAKAGAVDITIFAPSRDGGATIAPGPFPLVVFSPGFQLQRRQYAPSARHLASWGLVVISQDFPAFDFSGDHQKLATQTIAVVDWALAPERPLAAAIAPKQLALVGHSMGGKVSFLAASRDARFAAVVGWDPVDSNGPTAGDKAISVAPELMSDLPAKVAVIGETSNATTSGLGQACAPAADNFQQFFMAAPAPALEVTTLNADHMDYVDDTKNCLACAACAQGTAAPADVLAVSRRTTVAWLLRQLQGDARMDHWLSGAGIAEDPRVSFRIR